MLATANRQESDKGNLHTRKRAERIPRSITDIKPRAIATHADQNESVQGQQIRNEDISSPCRHHVSVEERRQSTPEHGSILDGLDPKEEGEDQQEDGNSLVIVASCDRARYVAGSDAHKGGGEETGRGRRDHLIGQEVCSQRRQAREAGCKKHADVADIDREGKESEDVVDDAAGDHQAGVESSASNSSKRMPCPYTIQSAFYPSSKPIRDIVYAGWHVRSSNQSQKL